MIPMNDVGNEVMQSVSGFYDALAPEYDSMTGFQKRFVHETPFIRLLVERYKIRSAVDAGCGTGFHALLLAQLGVQVTAIDVSAEMIHEVPKHAAELGVCITTVQADFKELKRIKGLKVDAVFTMGNSLAHLLSEEDLQLTLKSFESILNPGGILFIQNLNYDRILADKERLQSIKEVDEKTFVRFYDYGGTLLTFNVLTITRDDGISRQNLESVQLRPVSFVELSAMLSELRFEGITSFGSIAMDEYSPAKSKDLIVLARKKA